MERFIMEFPNSIPDMLCEDLINIFELEVDKQYKGIVQGGLLTDIKDASDIVIPQGNDRWKKIEEFLYIELGRCYKKYIKKINEKNEPFENINSTYTLLPENAFVKNFMIQKYDKGKGKYIYHDDFMVDNNNNHRIVTFLWYLNTIEHGGTTDFFNGEIKIKPEKGKLLLFPASWCYPHCGRTPLSDDKYIITNWFYHPYFGIVEVNNNKIID
jgi:hypothetical protein